MPVNCARQSFFKDPSCLLKFYIMFGLFLSKVTDKLFHYNKIL